MSTAVQFDWWVLMAATKAFTIPRWSGYVVIMTAASFIPFSMVTLVSVLDNWFGILQYFAFVLMGLVQGALIGFGQALAMRKTSVSVPGKQWVLVSALGTGATWAIALIPGFFVTPDLTNLIYSSIAAFFIIVVVSLFPYVQTRILRYRIRGAWRWIPITTGSWLIGALVFGLFTLLTRGDVNIFKAVGIMTVGGTIAVIIIAVLQGYGMRYLAKDVIASPRYGNILPDTPRVNAAKRKVSKVSNEAQARAKAAAKAAKVKAKSATKKVASRTKRR